MILNCRYNMRALSGTAAYLSLLMVLVLTSSQVEATCQVTTYKQGAGCTLDELDSYIIQDGDKGTYFKVADGFEDNFDLYGYCTDDGAIRDIYACPSFGSEQSACTQVVKDFVDTGNGCWNVRGQPYLFLT